MKNYILDTNVLLHDPNSLLNFADNHVVIPIEVIEEIDRFKRESSELGQNARQVSRMLDGFRGEGHLSEGVKLPNGGKLKIAFQKNGNGHANGDSHIVNGNSVDNRILLLAASIQKAQPKNPAILVSKDINLRIKADALGLQAEDYENDRVSHQGPLHRHDRVVRQHGKNGGVPRQRRTRSQRRQKIFSERILHAHWTRRIQKKQR